ncbi:BRD4-interacting chromatin-remodeling complex-associated protein [Gadus morhua]|uniref:BRD4-interacting chromatin-remodeling complex-associated protein n=1 Tax=Gadus morhua TaxID=8049 RepID=UPI0011B7B19A|nr:BRD4-interacting chromatin-remodeling complex-associated protein-like [Gadus morhua]
MDDEDGTCLFDVLCDPQALNDFLHGTNELQSEDLLISSSSGEPSLFTDPPSPVSLLGDDRDSSDTPPPGCVDLSFLEEALLSSPEGSREEVRQEVGDHRTPDDEDEDVGRGGGEEDEDEEEEEVQDGMACDILQQSLQEADITEQTLALGADLVHPGDGLSLYAPAPFLLPPLAPPFLPKPHTLPRDTQSAVEPPHPSLLAVGPGCPSLRPTGPPQLIGLLPGSVFPTPPPESSFSLSPAQASGMIIHKAMPSLTGRHLTGPGLRAATAASTPGILLHRAPLHIQPKLPVSIQPRLVQISPKPSGQKSQQGLTFVPGTPSSNILLSQAGSKAPPPQQQQQQQQQANQHLSKPLSLQLVNQGGSFVLQPQGLFQGQNQFLLPGQCPVTIAQQAGAAGPILTSSHQGSSVHGADRPHILTLPHRQLNFSPVFTSPSGQLSLRQATVLSGSLQLQSAAPTVFQMPAHLAGAYNPGGQGQRATLVHNSALGNHITLINSSGMLPPDLTSISILNGSQLVHGIPFAAPAPSLQAGVPEGQLNLQQASVVVLADRTLPEERVHPEETFHQLSQAFRPVVHHVSVKPPSPPVVTVLQAPAGDPLVPDLVPQLPKPLLPQTDMSQEVEELDHSTVTNQALIQLQQQALSSHPIIPSELLMGALPVEPMHSLDSTSDNEREALSQIQSSMAQADTLASLVDGCVELSPLPPDSEEALEHRSSRPVQETPNTASASFSPINQGAPSQPETPPAPVPGHQPQPLIQPPVLQASLPLMQNFDLVPQTQSEIQPQAHVLEAFVSNIQTQASVPHAHPELVVLDQDQVFNLSQHQHHPTYQQHDALVTPASLSSGAEEPAVEQHSLSKPAAALVLEGPEFSLDVPPPSLMTQALGSLGPLDHLEVLQEPSLQPEDQNTSYLSDYKTDLGSPPLTSSGLSTFSGQLAEHVEQVMEDRPTPAMRRLRFENQQLRDRAAIQTPYTHTSFTTLGEAVGRLLPYHACAGPLPSRDHFHLVDQEFDSVSGFLLKRTKDMVNKYRQLLVAEAQQDSPSAEMVMLERLFLQAERFALGEDRRRARRDPESFIAALTGPASAPGGPSGPLPRQSPPPTWPRLSDRPPGLKTYRSSSRGGLRLTIKHESGSRKVVRHSACDPARKRNHAGLLTNGGADSMRGRDKEAPGEAPPPRPLNGKGISNGAPPLKAPGPPPPVSKAAEPRTAPEVKPAGPIAVKEPRPVSPPRDVNPCVKRYRPEVPLWAELRASPAASPRQEDNVLTEHLQSAIDSILELQRLQGPSGAQSRAPLGPSLDQALTGILDGKPVR